MLSAPRRIGASRIAALRVRETDGDLGQSAPQLAVLCRGGLPRVFEDLVRMERHARIE